MCPKGCGIQNVTWIDPGSYEGNPLVNTSVVLECGHPRGEVLPAKRGSISVEKMDTPAGRRAFPK